MPCLPPTVSSSLSYGRFCPSDSRTRRATGSMWEIVVPSSSSMPLLGVALERMEVGDRRFGFVGQHRLGKRRALVWAPGLLADQQDPAGKAGLAHGDRGPAASLASA